MQVADDYHLQEGAGERLKLAESIAYDSSFLDAPLTLTGVQQCEDAIEIVHSLPAIRRVYVSPMRRAIETAWRLFS